MLITASVTAIDIRRHAKMNYQSEKVVGRVDKATHCAFLRG